MKLYAVIDENNGLSFNQRRQSRDKELVNDIIRDVGRSTLWLDTYSAKLFYEEPPWNMYVHENYMYHAKDKDCCFMELIPLEFNDERIDTIVLYNWNKKYPADSFFPVMLEDDWIKVSTRDINGHSHKTITKEVWKRKD